MISREQDCRGTLSSGNSLSMNADYNRGEIALERESRRSRLRAIQSHGFENRVAGKISAYRIGDGRAAITV